MFFLQSTFLFLFGLFVGTFGTMLGIGGGWLHVLFLMLLFNFTPQDAIGTSIGIIFFNTLAGSLVYYHQRRMDFQLAKTMVLAVIPGAILGPLIVQQYTTSFFMMIFSLFLIAIALYMFFRARPVTLLPEAKYNRVTTITDIFGETVTYKTSRELGIIGTFVIGFISNLLGIGGGIIHVPYLILVMRIPTHIALGTSHFILCVSSFVGMLMFFFLGNIKIDFMMPIALGAIVGASLGADLARKTESDVIKKIISIVIFLVACKILIRAL
ncbi:MAG: sulfite exporter TauE/SafE family protein [Deltaproteobacteria bacterium]|nr:sulfite exporter TauE/SafE family protein [Deltaproteobacteria bacterium]